MRRGNVNIQLVILVIYISLLVVVSVIANRIQSKHGSGAAEYLLAGRKLPALMIATMLAGLAIGGASTVGVAQNAYTQGLSAGWYNAAWGVAGIVVGIFAAKYLRRIEVVTIPEMMGKMFGPGARILGAIAQLLIMMVITSLQYVAGGAVLAALLPDIFTFHSGMVATAALFVGIAVAGGYLAGGLASVINVIVIYGGICAALISSLNSVGGMENLVISMPVGAPWFDWVSGVGIAVVAAWMVVMVTQAFSVQAISQIAFAARDEKAAQKGFILGGMIIIPVGFLCAMFGIIAAYKFPGLQNSAMALPTLMTSISPLIGGIFLAALWAADISTAVALLLGSVTLVLEDIWKRISHRTLSEKQEILVSRIIILFVSAFTFILAITSVSILKTITSALAVMVSFTILILVNLIAPRLCKRISGFWTILTSLLIWVAWTFIPQVRIVPHVIYLEWPVCLGVFLLTSILGKEPAHDILESKRKEELPHIELNKGEALIEEV